MGRAGDVRSRCFPRGVTWHILARMSFSAFALVVLGRRSACLWNLAAKRTAGNLGVFWLGSAWPASSLSLLLYRSPCQPGMGADAVYCFTGLIHSF